MPYRAYVDALLIDLEQSLPLVWGRKVQSVFFGGGTPSLLSAELLDELLCRMRALLPLAYEAEVTLEANPGTVEAGKFVGFRNAGVNRLSLGIQSFHDGYLKALGRIHDGREAHHAVELALATFDNVNLDLMYALPRQTREHALADIHTAIGYAPKHISAYHLTIEPNTAFHHQPPSVPDDDTSGGMQEDIEQALLQAGYVHYETSAFARAGWTCRHNLNYWQFGDYLGIGAGAHGKLSFADRIVRQARVKHPAAYMQGVNTGQHVESEQTIGRRDLGFEFMMNALRLTGGFPVSMFQERTGLPLSAVHHGLEMALQRGLIERDSLRIQPTLLGQHHLNDLLQIFL